MNILKILNALTIFLIVLNFLAGVMGLYPLPVIAVFIVLHAVVRKIYLTKEAGSSTTNNAPQAIRMVAVVVTAVIMANVLYWLGFGVHYLIGMVA